MPKNTFPMMKTGGGAGKKLLGMAAVLAVLVLVVNNPVAAAGWTKQAFALLGQFVNALATFFGGVLG
ncbi:hypothetical protein [Saccharopolyspora cebuensis]|uniref:Uncharacterized protein n=1 Tax=Saccharopolyspora cebuensis TaxID=418759 RepID=A0ABV4CJZ4_9PSEU